MKISHQKSDEIIGKLEDGTCEYKPGWVRFSIHPTTTNDEIEYVCDSLIALAENYEEWVKDYKSSEGRFIHKNEVANPLSNSWFEF